MKSMILTLVALVTLGTSSFAKAAVTDFQALITESLEAKKELTEKLKKHSPEAKIAREKIVIRENEVQTENVVAPSQNLAHSPGLNETDSLQFEQKNMKRVSEELKDAQ